jgi:hypothetical protein
MLIDGQSSLRVDRQTIGARLKVFGNVPARIAAIVLEYRECSVSRILVNLMAFWSLKRKSPFFIQIGPSVN